MTKTKKQQTPVKNSGRTDGLDNQQLQSVQSAIHWLEGQLLQLITDRKSEDRSTPAADTKDIHEENLGDKEDPASKISENGGQQKDGDVKDLLRPVSTGAPNSTGDVPSTEHTDTSIDSTASPDNLGAANNDVQDELAAGIDTSSDGNQDAPSPDLSDPNRHSYDCSDVPSAKLKPVDQASTEGQNISDTSPPGSFNQHANTEASKVDIQQVLSRITLLESKVKTLETKNRKLEEEVHILKGVKHGCSCNPGKQGQ